MNWAFGLIIKGTPLAQTAPMPSSGRPSASTTQPMSLLPSGASISCRFGRLPLKRDPRCVGKVSSTKSQAPFPSNTALILRSHDALLWPKAIETF